MGEVSAGEGLIMDNKTKGLWYCQLRQHYYNAAGLGLLPYKVLCGPCAGRECTCRKGEAKLGKCDACGKKHEARCTVWACPEHFEELGHD